MTRTPTVLLVEDNPTTRKMLRVTLETERFRVIEAGDGRAALAAVERERPDLVLQDLILPDIDGRDLVTRLRAMPAMADVPILALSGFLSRIEESRTAASGFTAFLVKPIEPSRLVETIRGYLPIDEAAPTATGGPRLLIVDDDAVQLKLARLQFVQRGYAVTTATSAGQALEAARASRPDVVLSDVFMPETDGFQLCLALRREAALASVPVVLVSSVYGSAADRTLAADVGAHALVQRTPDLGEAADAVAAALAAPPPGPPDTPTSELELAHARLVIQQLERQAAAMSGLVQRSAFQAAQISLLSGVADALTNRGDVDGALRDVLAATLDAAGISKGALFLIDDAGRLVVRQAIGFTNGQFGGLAGFFGHMDEFARIVRAGASVSVPSGSISREAADAVMAAADVVSAQIVPLSSRGRPVGAMVIAASQTDVTTEDSVSFARAMGNQLVQSLALSASIESLGASEERYRTLVEHANDAIAVLTTDGVVREGNRRLAALLGVAISELPGTRLPAFVTTDVRAPRAHEAPEQAVRVVEVDGHDGRVRQVEVSIAPFEVSGEALVIAIARDVTEHRQLSEQLRQSQKLEAIGQLAGGVAHDFNNMLTSILGFADLAAGTLPAGHIAREYLAELRGSGERATGLTRQLLAFGRKQIVRPRVIDVGRQLREFEPMLRRLIRADVDLQIAAPARALPVSIDPLQVEQIVLNLAINAVDAMPRGGTLRMVTSRRTLFEGAVRMPRVAPGPYVELLVSDTGLGMDEATRQRIFEPFFTTKEAGKGTGLGLATVYGIVTQLGGGIGVDSMPGQGTTFTVLLPVIEEADADEVAEQARPRELPRGTETILVVEDDDAVRSLARLSLERAGYMVLLAPDPVEGERVARQYPGPVHLLVSDVIMPRAGGGPLVDRLRPERPSLRVLYISGYTDATAGFGAHIGPDTPFLAKPFTPEELAIKVRDVLDA